MTRRLFAIPIALLILGLAWTPALAVGPHQHRHHHRQQVPLCVLPVPGQLTPALCLLAPPAGRDRDDISPFS